MKNIVIIGAGGHTRSSANLLKQYFKDASFLIYDDNYNPKVEEYINDAKIVGTVSNIDNTMRNIFLSVGNNKKRENYFDLFNKIIIKENLIHTSAYLERNIKLGFANQIFANAYVNSYVEIGDNNIINTSAILEHEVTIGSHNHISVSARLCGRVSLGDRCFIGAGAIIIDKVSICNDVTIGAGAVVVENLTEPGTYVGNPVRKVK